MPDSLSMMICLNHRYLNKSRLLKFCYVPATSAAFSKGIFVAATISTNKRNKAGSSCHQSVYLSQMSMVWINTFNSHFFPFQKPYFRFPDSHHTRTQVFIYFVYKIFNQSECLSHGKGKFNKSFYIAWKKITRLSLNRLFYSQAIWQKYLKKDKLSGYIDLTDNFLVKLCDVNIS